MHTVDRDGVSNTNFIIMQADVADDNLEMLVRSLSDLVEAEDETARNSLQRTPSQVPALRLNLQSLPV